MEKQNNYLITPTSPKIYSYHFIFILILSFFLFDILSKLPREGYYVYQFIKIDNKWLQKKLLKVLTYNITYNSMKSSLLYSVGFLNMISLYLYLKATTTKFTFTSKYLEKEHGVLNKKTDCIDMIDIRDQEMNRNIFHRLIGISKITIFSRDITNPQLDIFLGKNEANEAMSFLKLNSTRNIVDYRLSQDMKNQKKNSRIQIIDEEQDSPEDYPHN